MLRYLGEFFSLILFFAVARSVISTVAQMFRGVGGVSNPPQRSESEPRDIRTSGELRKDPVCGTFVAMSTPYTKMEGRETHYFCSKECRDAFKSSKPWPKSSPVRS